MIDTCHLNTLYITTEGAYARKDGENAVIEIDRVERLRVPLHKLGSISGAVAPRAGAWIGTCFDFMCEHHFGSVTAG
jgi:hypothetical protein